MEWAFCVLPTVICDGQARMLFSLAKEMPKIRDIEVFSRVFGDKSWLKWSLPVILTPSQHGLSLSLPAPFVRNGLLVVCFRTL